MEIIVLKLKFLFPIIIATQSFNLIAKELRVGSSGDYPPLTQYNFDKETWEGSDIEFIKEFAQEKGYTIKFIQTSWPTLTKDLEHDKFDLAIGGISISPERQKKFLISNSILEFGKVAYVLCEKKNLFSANSSSEILKNIDQKETIIVENPGGTNLSFAQQNIKNAKIIISKDNDDAFQTLENKKADVMFTDSIEVEYRASTGKYKNICPLSKTVLLTNGHKIVLVTKNKKELLDEVNNFIAKKKKTPPFTSKDNN